MSPVAPGGGQQRPRRRAAGEVGSQHNAVARPRAPPPAAGAAARARGGACPRARAPPRRPSRLSRCEPTGATTAADAKAIGRDAALSRRRRRARNDAGDALASRNWSERHTAVAPSEPPAAKRAPFGPHATDDTETPFVVPKPVFAFVVPEPKESSKRGGPAVTPRMRVRPKRSPAAALPGDASRTPRAGDAAAASARPARWTRLYASSTRAVGGRTAPANAPGDAVRVGGEPPDRHGAERVAGEEHGLRGCASTHRAAASPGTPPPANAAPMSGASAAPMAAAFAPRRPRRRRRTIGGGGPSRCARRVRGSGGGGARPHARHLPRRGAPRAPPRGTPASRRRGSVGPARRTPPVFWVRPQTRERRGVVAAARSTAAAPAAPGVPPSGARGAPAAASARAGRR